MVISIYSLNLNVNVRAQQVDATQMQYLHYIEIQYPNIDYY